MKENNSIIEKLHKDYGVQVKHSSDAQLHRSLRDEGLPTLSRLLKKIS